MLSVPALPCGGRLMEITVLQKHWHLDCLGVQWQVIRCGGEQNKGEVIGLKWQKMESGKLISFFFLFNKWSVRNGRNWPLFLPSSHWRETFLLHSPLHENRLVYLEPVAAPRAQAFFCVKKRQNTMALFAIFKVCLPEQNCILNINCLLTVTLIPVVEVYFWAKKLSFGKTKRIKRTLGGGGSENNANSGKASTNTQHCEPPWSFEQSRVEGEKKQNKKCLNTSNLTTHSSTNAFLMDELFMRSSLDCYTGQTQHSFAVSFACVLFLSPLQLKEKQHIGFPCNQPTYTSP